MKSVYIITGGILVIVAIVFLAPQKQDKTEEKTSSQLDEIESIILKEYGDDLTPEEKEITYEAIAEELALDKAELKKYGRLLTDEERYQLEWQAEVKAHEKAKFTELYAEQKDWIDNFPFRPGYHPDIVYDPENNIAHSTEKYSAYREEKQKERQTAEDRYDRKTHEIWSMGDEMTTDEKHAACKKLRIEKEKAGKLDPEIEEQRRIMVRHKRLAGFYKQHYRYYPEFEQAYRIFEEEGLDANPIRLAHTMVGLENYFVSKRQGMHDPDELHPVQTRWDPETKQRRRITWGELIEEDFRIVRNCVRSEWVAAAGEERPSVELAERIRDRLIAEIPPDGFTGQTFLFGLADPKDEDMVPGQSLLAE